MGQSLSRAEQSRAEQSRAEQSRAEQSRAEQSRELWLDVCKGLGILLVVLGHACSGYDGGGGFFRKLIYGFHMPMFFIISGYLYKPKEHAIKHYSQKYLLPYIILCCINLVLELPQDVILGDSLSKLKTYLIGIAFVKPSVQWMPNCTPLWFLACLAFSLMLYNFVFRITDSRNLTDDNTQHIQNLQLVRFAVELALMIAGYILYIVDVPKQPWTLDTVLMVPFFLEIGHQIRRMQDELDKILKPGMMVLMVVVGIICIIANPIEIDSAARTYGNLALMIPGSVLTSISVMWICRMYCKASGSGCCTRSKNVVISALTWFGKHTVFFMGFDYFSGHIVKFVFLLIGMNHWLTLFIGKVIVLTIGCIIWNKLIMLLPHRIRNQLSY